jgi:hypothetical protein
MKKLHVLLAASFAFAAIASTRAQTNLWQNSGNIGIGTTGPGTSLQIVGPFTPGYTQLMVQSTGSDDRQGIAFYNSIGQRTGIIYTGPAVGGDMIIGREQAGMIRFFSDGGERLTVATNGNVGVGLTNPAAKLDVRGQAIASSVYGSGWIAGLLDADVVSGTARVAATSGNGVGRPPLSFVVGDVERIRIQPNGNIGIGTSNPGANRLQIAGAVGTNDYTLSAQHNMQLRIVNGLGSQNSRALELGLLDNGTSIIQSNECGVGYNALSLNPVAGNVGIGTTSPTHKLSVNGTVRAREVIVDNTNWSDYVFADDYKLQSLAHVEAQIKTNRHLPGVPSAREVAEKGISVGDMQAILLAKIEELTLHQIAQEKEQVAQRAKLESQAAKIALLEAENAQLKR